MPIVQAKCENCGGVLAVDDGQKAAICPFCNTPYVVQDAINNYNITNNINVGAGAVVNIYSNQNSDFEIEAGILKKYKGTSTDVIIPNIVTEIDFQAFYKLPITSVTIPDSVTNIGNYAFAKCDKLNKVTFGNSITKIGNAAFSNCSSLKNITIPNCVTEIIACAFCHCTSLEDVNLGNGVREIGYAVFGGCTSLKRIIIPDSVSRIGGCAFADCISLSDITIPDSVISIGETPFIRACPNININASNVIKSLIEKANVPIKHESNGCYVATAVYGSYDCPQVWTLRRYRDYCLDSTWYGRLFIMLYYAISPTLVKWFGETTWFKKLWRGELDRMVEKLQNEGYESTPYNDKY